MLIKLTHLSSSIEFPLRTFVGTIWQSQIWVLTNLIRRGGRGEQHIFFLKKDFFLDAISKIKDHLSLFR